MSTKTLPDSYIEVLASNYDDLSPKSWMTGYKRSGFEALATFGSILVALFAGLLPITPVFPFFSKEDDIPLNVLALTFVGACVVFFISHALGKYIVQKHYSNLKIKEHETLKAILEILRLKGFTLADEMEDEPDTLSYFLEHHEAPFVNEDGVEYILTDINFDEDGISFDFSLSDLKIIEEKRVNQLAQHAENCAANLAQHAENRATRWEAKHGKFSSSVEREAFKNGVIFS